MEQMNPVFQIPFVVMLQNVLFFLAYAAWLVFFAFVIYLAYKFIKLCVHDYYKYTYVPKYRDSIHASGSDRILPILYAIIILFAIIVFMVLTYYVMGLSILLYSILASVALLMYKIVREQLKKRND